MDGPQTFTSPSGDDVYETPAGEVPLDDTFLDTRFALNVSWSQPLRTSLHDERGTGLLHGIRLHAPRRQPWRNPRLQPRNTTLSAAVAYAQENIDPVGGTPLPLALMQDVGDDSSKAGTDTKDVLDLLLGVTQVIGPSTVLRVNYSYSDSSGYLTDPYKILSVVDPVTGDIVARAPAGRLGPTGVYRFESRPDSRRKQGLYAEVKHDFTARCSVSRIGIAPMTGASTHTPSTLDCAGRSANSTTSSRTCATTRKTPPTSTVSACSTVTLAAFASADARLADLDGVTLGLKYGHRTAGSEWNARVELYQQSGNVPGGQLIGNQSRHEQFPDLDAVIVQFGYRFKL